MPEEHTRLRRLLENELGECCDADVHERVHQLETLERTLPADTTADRTALGTLGDETRYRIVRLLAAADDELCVCELSPLLEVSDSAISHALSDLTDAGLVSRRKDGQWRYYRTTERAEALVETLDTTRETGNGEPVRLAFVCVRNAGRSQMAAAFAERELERHGLGDRVEVVSGGTDPAEAVHGVVVEAMAELDVDLGSRTPSEVDDETLASCDYVATMGCSTLELDPDADVEVRDWALEDPHGRDLGTVREIRSEVRERVRALFDEAFGEHDSDTDAPR